MPRDLPGYYYDKEKGKYFAIEPSTTAPPNAEWNADNLKKKRHRQSEENHKAKLRKLKTATGVRRNVALLKSIHGTCYRNEMGAYARDRLNFMARVYTTCLARPESLNLPMTSPVYGQEPIGTFCISSSEMSHFRGAACAVHWLDPSPSSLTYGIFDVPRDGESWSFKDNPIANAMEAPSDIISLKYNEPLDVIVATSYASLVYFPFFSDSFQEGHRRRPFGFQSLASRGNFIKKCTIAPAACQYICTLATSKGAEVVYANPSGVSRSTLTGWDYSPKDRTSFDIWDTCVSVGNPHLIYSVSKNGICYRHDTRMDPMDGTYWKMGDKIPYNYIRSIDERRFLVAGLLNKMSIFDTRWPPHRNTVATVQDKSTTPYLRFPEYRNKEHPSVGLDVDLDSGVVAAAHDNGEVGIYSLRSGEQLDCKRAQMPDTVVRCVQFHTLPGQSAADLYVGHTKTRITRYSLRGRKDCDEDDLYCTSGEPAADGGPYY